MTLEVWKDSQQLGGFVLCVVTVPLCIVTVALRFAANIKSTGKIGMETWFAFVSLIFFLVYTLMFLYRKSPLVWDAAIATISVI